MRYLLFIVFVCHFWLGFSQQDSLDINLLLDKAYEKETTNPNEALKLYKTAYLKSKKSDYKIGVVKSLQYSGIVHSDLANYDSAIYYYNKALPYSLKYNDNKSIGGIYINLGNAYQYKGQFNKVIDNYIKGIKIFETIKDSSRLAVSYENLASFYSSLKNTEKELEYLKKSLSIIPKDDAESLAYVLGDIALAHIKLKEFPDALKNLNRAYKTSKTLNDNRLHFFSERNFGEYYYGKSEYKKAIPYYEKALKIISQINDAYYKNDVLLQLGQTEAELKNYNKAIQYLNETISTAKENNALEIEQKAHNTLSIIYNTIQNSNKAYFHLNKATQLKDSLLNENHLKQINLLEKQYESEKKDKELAEKQIELEHNTLELSKKENQFTIAIISTIALLLILLALWIFYRQRQKLKNIEISKLEQDRDLSKMQALIEGEEKERIRLAQDLHDGINGDLSSIKFQLSSINSESFTKENKKLFETAIDMIDYSCDQVRNISHNLSPTTINDFGLVASLKSYCSKLEGFYPIKINFQHFGNDIQLPKNIETVIYRIVQELVNNIIKHAEASEALVQINSHEDTLFITVEDNGKGFDYLKKNMGIGLKNIKSRIDFLNATLDEEHNKNGTTFTINIDLKNIPKT
jgi:two-component system, NarL family, sensor kinase